MDLRNQTKWRTFLEQGSTEAVDRWRFYEIRGAKGSIWPYSETHLAVLFNRNRLGCRIQRERPEWPLLQNGEHEMVFKVSNAELDLAARSIRAYKRRHLSDEQRKLASERLLQSRRKAQEGHRGTTGAR